MISRYTPPEVIEPTIEYGKTVYKLTSSLNILANVAPHLSIAFLPDTARNIHDVEIHALADDVSVIVAPTGFLGTDPNSVHPDGREAQIPVTITNPEESTKLPARYVFVPEQKAWHKLKG